MRREIEELKNYVSATEKHGAVVTNGKPGDVILIAPADGPACNTGIVVSGKPLSKADYDSMSIVVDFEGRNLQF